ncbi:hypothetical protein [Calothrix sp. 336/3]|uniref:hypothetical protein n=1 Tax=Calothrix sp. 336/3 TaxID=1337936 RepID=UPI00118756C1|nr:hypothetical protein [Calothrix sp. 336/3]
MVRVSRFFGWHDFEPKDALLLVSQLFESLYTALDKTSKTLTCHESPVHLNEHIAENRHMPGIFILNPNLSAGQNLEELILLAEYSFEGEYQDQIIHLPIN